MTEIEQCIMWAHRAQSVAEQPQVVRFYELCETALRAQQEQSRELLEKIAQAIIEIMGNGGCPPDKDCERNRNCNRCYIEWLTQTLPPFQQQSNEPLMLDELRKMELHQWIWIDVLQPFDCNDQISGYYKKHHDCTHGEAFCCGYIGIVFGFDYADYGKTWLAYRRKPEQEDGK